MIKKTLAVTIILLLTFGTGCSAVSDLTGHLGHTSFVANPDTATKVELSSKWLTNQTKTMVTFSVSSLPDLIIEDIAWSPVSPSAGDTVTFTVTIKNQGSGEASYFYIAYYIDDDYVASTYISRIAPGATVTETFSCTAQVGSHAVKAVADYKGTVTESNETNNVETFHFSTLAPDLIVQSITWSPGNPSKGDNITFDVAVNNQGTSKAGWSRVYFYIDDYYRGYQNVPEMPPGTTVTKSFPWTVRAGLHAIKAIADYKNTVIESDETNNEKTVTFLPLAPDLVVKDIEWSPPNPVERDTVTFTVTVENQGRSRVDSSTVAYYVDGDYRTFDYVDPLDLGATDNKTFTWRAWAGSHTIKAVADPDNKVIESDETNNEKTVTLPTLAPDLIIEDITWLPESPSVGDTVTFSVNIRNQGNAGSSFSRFCFSIGAFYNSSQGIDRIDAADNVTKTFTWVAEAGSFAVEVIADPDNKVIESDETNNEKTVTFSGAKFPDLIIQNIAWSPASPSVGDTVTFTVTTKNQGSGTADYSYVAYYIDGTRLTSAYVRPLDPSASDNTTFTWIVQAGEHAIKAVADTTLDITESNETNNEKTIIYPVPTDLIIQSITWSPAEPSIGDTVTFTVTIKNQGSGKAGLFRVNFYIDDSSRGYQYIQEIDAGASMSKTFYWTVQAGEHAIKVVADPTKKVSESDETNNEKTVIYPHGETLIYPVPADLVVQSITWSPESPSESDNMTFIVAIKNRGSNKADSSIIAYYIDDIYLTSASISPIDPGATGNNTFIWTAKAGEHVIKVVADPDDEVTEDDEDNNEKTVAFSVSLLPAPAPVPEPAPTPSKKTPEAPPRAPTPVPLPEDEGRSDLWLFFLPMVIGGSVLIILVLKLRQR